MQHNIAIICSEPEQVIDNLQEVESFCASNYHARFQTATVEGLGLSYTRKMFLGSNVPVSRNDEALKAESGSVRSQPIPNDSEQLPEMQIHDIYISKHS